MLPTYLAGQAVFAGPKNTNHFLNQMRFITFAATTLLGCLLSSGMCAATPISVGSGHQYLQKITARSPPELVRRNPPAYQLSWVTQDPQDEFITDLPQNLVSTAEMEVTKATHHFNEERFKENRHFIPKLLTFRAGEAPVVLKCGGVECIRFNYIDGPSGEVYEGKLFESETSSHVQILYKGKVDYEEGKPKISARPGRSGQK
ncbi:hypothetical protein BDP27DRAFT_1436048 [Rhodocollybia butyracea]|uniref:Uncharacterized protein n=1 Tax=Rhodocollybia butyracea TaxID=206335 RepID=A0A9P5P466_9AGAR|nr:hypothetical protein BDP27DRAFT_1436048 [Rhodocollybia butyracea]